MEQPFQATHQTCFLHAIVQHYPLSSTVKNQKDPSSSTNQYQLYRKSLSERYCARLAQISIIQIYQEIQTILSRLNDIYAYLQFFESTTQKQFPHEIIFIYINIDCISQLRYQTRELSIEHKLNFSRLNFCEFNRFQCKFIFEVMSKAIIQQRKSKKNDSSIKRTSQNQKEFSFINSQNTAYATTGDTYDQHISESYEHHRLRQALYEAIEENQFLRQRVVELEALLAEAQDRLQNQSDRYTLDINFLQQSHKKINKINCLQQERPYSL